MEKKVLTIGGKTYCIKYDDFEDDVDVDDLLKVDYSNLIGELVTFPVILNKFGLLLAEAESNLSEARLSLDVFEAKTKERLRIELTEANKGKAPTVEALNNAVTVDRGWQDLKRKHIEAIKVRDYINSIYWAARDKSSKIEKLSLTVQNEDLPSEVLEGRVNRVLLRKVDNLIK